MKAIPFKQQLHYPTSSEY